MRHDKDPTLFVNFILVIIFTGISILFAVLTQSAFNNQSESATGLLILTCISVFITGIGSTSLYTEKELDDMELHPKTNRDWIETLDDDKFSYVITSLSPCDFCTENLTDCEIDSNECYVHIINWLNADYNPDDVFVKSINEMENILDD